jgi:hypothetical protein
MYRSEFLGTAKQMIVNEKKTLFAVSLFRLSPFALRFSPFAGGSGLAL